MFSFQFHIRDYVCKTRHLSLMEDLAYRRLMDAYYTEESPLPADVQACARLVAMRDHAASVEAVLKEFFLLTDAGWTNARCDQEIAKFRQMQERGRRASSMRWKEIDAPQPNDDQAIDQMIDQRIDQTSDASLMPTNNHKPITNTKPKTTTSGKATFDWETGEWVSVDYLIPAWVDAYPDLDVQAELRKARAWVLANPAKAKKDWPRFLNNWMSRNGAVTNPVSAVGQTPTTSVFEGLA